MGLWSSFKEERFFLFFQDLLKYIAEFYIHTTDGLAESYENGLVNMGRTKNFYIYVVSSMTKEYIVSGECSPKKASAITNALSEFRFGALGDNFRSYKDDDNDYDRSKTTDELIEKFTEKCIRSGKENMTKIKASMKKNSPILFPRVYLSIKKCKVVRR